MKKRWKFVVAGVVILGALGFLGYRGYMSSAAYYLLVDELLARGPEMVNERVRLAGVVEPGSIVQSGRNLKFTVANNGQGIAVVYEGVVPDAFRAGGDITIEGMLDEGGTFMASVLTPKCPSKYTPE